jgi:hypothetical protein
MNTHTQILPLWAPLKDWASTELEIPEVTYGASSSTGTDLEIPEVTISILLLTETPLTT